MQHPIVVTGGAGFIGSNLVNYFLENGQRVKVVDDLSTGILNRLPLDDSQPWKLECCMFSVDYYSELRKQFTGAKYIYHLAAIPRVQKSIESPILTAKANIMGTIAVLEAARKAEVKRVVFVSSSAVYGMKSPYAVQKKQGEDWCRLYHELYGLETVVLRYFNVYGPDMDLGSDYATVIPRFLTEDPVTIYGDGEQTRCFTYIDDVVKATHLAMYSTKAVGKVMDIGSDPISVNDLARMITDKEPNYEPERAGEQKHSQAEHARAITYLGWKPETSLTEGLAKTKVWLDEELSRNSQKK